MTRQRMLLTHRACRAFPLAILLAMGLVGGLLLGSVRVSRASAPTSLSTYWSYKIQRWDALILQEAERRHLDPDFLASLVWMESRGDPEAVGPVGAVGLMQVMPKEAGFSWRPLQDELMDPGTNLYWGARTLATVVRQGEGDIFNSLAAYNGGWDQIMYRGPKIFATTILRDYARAVATRRQITGTWSAFFAVKRQQIGGPIWVTSSDREDVFLYGAYNWTPEGTPVIPAIAPTAVLAECEDEETGRAFAIGIWFYDHQGERWVVGQPVAPPTSTPTPTPRAAPSMKMASSVQRLVDYVVSSISVPVGSRHDVSTPAPPTATPVPHEDGGQGEAGMSSMSFDFGTDDSTWAPEQTVHDPEPSPPPPLPMQACTGAELTASAWPMEREYTGQGWKARVFAEGRGGDCVYTYAWNDLSDIRGEAMTGPIVFEVSTDRQDAVIVGTVVVISGGETKRVGVYITPP
ncbi:MAG: lytic transglycosylase domain-containing protein [Anaerolineae bacterium]